MGEWSNLTQREKSNIIRFAIKNGVSDINTIRDTFNVYAKDSLANVEYNMAAAKASGFGSNGNGHYPDAFKKPNHPTFSDESIYHSEATPGGHWSERNSLQRWDFSPSAQQISQPGYIQKAIDYLNNNESEGVTLTDSQGRYPSINGTIYGGVLPEITVTSQYKEGGSIHIKHPGRLTALKERTGKTEAELWATGNAHTRKMITFARNARKWKHDEGGYLDTANILGKGGEIYIKPSKRGTFTAAATKHGKSVQKFARQVLANKENYSPAMVRKANFARNAAHWHSGEEGTSYLNRPDMISDAKDNYNFLYNWFSNRPILTEGQKESIINGGLRHLNKTYIDYRPSDNSRYDPEKNMIIIGDEFSGKSGLLHEMTHALTHGTKEAVEEYDEVPKIGIRYAVERSPYYLIPTFMVPGSMGSSVYNKEGSLSAKENISFPLFYNTATKDSLKNNLNHWDTTVAYNPSKVEEVRRSFGKVQHDDHIAEQYARLMQLRQANNISPEKTNWTLEEIEALRNSPELKDFNIFSRYTNEYIQNMFNNWAYNNTSNPFNLGNNRHIASTGGPLYPFSFQKNPYWKTPVVRYADGGEIRNWDTTLTGKLINYVENSDSIGWKPIDRTWEHPTKPGYDKNQIGMGIDKNKTPGYWDHIQYRPKTNVPFLTELDERLIRHNAIEAANKSANARYKFAQGAVNKPKGTISPIKDAAVVSAIYNLGAGYVANGLFEDKDFMLKLFDGTDKEVVDRINQEYKKKGRNERIAKTNLFLFQK